MDAVCTVVTFARCAAVCVMLVTLQFQPFEAACIVTVQPVAVPPVPPVTTHATDPFAVVTAGEVPQDAGADGAVPLTNMAPAPAPVEIPLTP